jgi:hypothetical protein
MEIRPIGSRRRYVKNYEVSNNQAYDYERYGLLNKVLPKVIYETKNTSTKAVLRFVEYILVWLMKYVDDLKNFKNWNYKDI